MNYVRGGSDEYYLAHRHIIELIEIMPSAQSEKTHLSKGEPMSDLIYRQDAIYMIDKYISGFDAIDANFLDGLKTAKKLIKEELLSA